MLLPRWMCLAISSISESRNQLTEPVGTYRPECLEICTYMFFVCYAGDPMEWGPVYWRGAHQEAGQE